MDSADERIHSDVGQLEVAGVHVCQKSRRSYRGRNSEPEWKRRIASVGYGPPVMDEALLRYNPRDDGPKQGTNPLSFICFRCAADVAFRCLPELELRTGILFSSADSGIFFRARADERAIIQRRNPYRKPLGLVLHHPEI